jgi:uncharacterized membrane protein YdbT with pleckstrin-like domain
VLSRADTLAFILSTIAPFPVKSIPDIVTAICSILSLAGVTTVIITGISFIIAQIYRNANTYLLTHDRIIIRRSLLSSIRREIPYSKISDVTIEQTLLGRIFGYGDVIPISISGFGITGQERYPSEKRLDQLDSVAKPREISQRILTHMRA